MKTRNKESAIYYYDEKSNIASACWREPDGSQKRTTYAHWLWEINHGSIPDGYICRWKDGNPKNVVIENVELISPEQIGSEISRRLMGHGFSDETLKKLSDAKKGKFLSNEHKTKIGSATSRMWKDGVFDKPEIREAYAKQGRSTKGSKRTEEQRKKMSDAGKGKDITRLHTKEAAEKRKIALKNFHPTPESNLKRSNSQKGRIFSDEHLENLSKANKNRKDLKGENSRWWKGGIANDPYPEEFSDYLKRKIRKRDKYLCQSCSENVYGSPRGHVHHIDGNKQNCSPSNLVLLCATCHNAVHGRNSITGEKIIYYKSKLG